MSEKDIDVYNVKRHREENNRDIMIAKNAIGMCSNEIENAKKRIIQLEKEHKLRIDEQQKRIDRQVKNLKAYHDSLDDLVDQKEMIIKELKTALHIGQEQCDWCGVYYTKAGLKRHKKSCASNPKTKQIKTHEKELALDKEVLKKRKAELEKQLKDLGD